MVRLQAFFDDSGVGQEPVYCLAGYIGPADRWASFSDEWRSFLNEPPALKYWKTSHVMSFRGQLTNWSREDRDEKLAKATSIIQKYNFLGFSVMMLHDHYVDVFSDLLHAKQWHPYRILLGGLVSYLDSYLLEHSIDEPVEVFLDTQTEQKADAIAAWQEEFAFHPHRRRSVFSSEPSWGDEKEILPIQAADMIAWEIRQGAAKTLRNKPISRLPWAPSESVGAAIYCFTRLSLMNARLTAVFEGLVRSGIWKALPEPTPDPFIESNTLIRAPLEWTAFRE